MAQGDQRRFEFAESRDPETGARIVRLTPPGVMGVRNYFYQRAFTADGRLLLGTRSEGVLSLWLLDLATGRAVQITDGEGVNVQGSTLSPDDRYVYYARGRGQYLRVALDTLEEEVVYTCPPGWSAYGTWALDDRGARVAAIEIWSDDRVQGLSGWEAFAAQFHRAPRQRLLDVDLATGAVTVVWDEKRFIGHPMFRPGQPSLLGFCHEGPHDLVDSRIWMVIPGSPPRRVKDHEPGEACMHEFWVPDGSRLLFVGYQKGQTLRTVQAFDPASWTTRVVMEIPPCAHLMSNHDGSLLVADGAGQLGDVADQEGHAFEPDPHLYLFDLKGKTSRVLCRHDSTWAVYGGNTQISHPHPSFTPDESRVLFASDREGFPAVYLVDLSS